LPYQVGGVVGPGWGATHFQAQHVLKGFWWRLCAALAMLVRTYPDIHSIIHSTIQSFIHSTIIHSLNHSFLQASIHLSMHACIHSYVIHSIACCTLQQLTSVTTTVFLLLMIIT